MTQFNGKIHLLLWVEILSLRVIFSTFLQIQSTLKQRRVWFNCTRMDIFTLFVEKVEIATILLHNFIFGGYLYQMVDISTS